MIDSGRRVLAKKSFTESSFFKNNDGEDEFDFSKGYQFETPDNSFGDFFSTNSWDISANLGDLIMDEDDDFKTNDIEEIDSTNGWGAWSDDDWSSGWEDESDFDNDGWNQNSFFDDDSVWNSFDWDNFSPLLW